MQNLFWLFCPFSSLLTPNTHCMCPVIPKYLHFKNSHVLSWLCPWANCSFFLKWLSSHLDFLKKIFLGLTCLSRFTWVVSQRIKSEDLLRIPWSELQATCFKSQSTLCTPVRASCAQKVISQDWPSCVCFSLSPLCPRLSECWFHFSFLIFFIPVCLVAQSCSALCDPMDCSPPGSSVHGNSPGKNTREGCHALLQGIFPTQGSNPGLLRCRQFLYRLSTYLAHGKG